MKNSMVLVSKTGELLGYVLIKQEKKIKSKREKSQDSRISCVLSETCTFPETLLPLLHIHVIELEVRVKDLPVLGCCSEMKFPFS